MSTLGDFLNAGQQRRAWLNDTLESFIPPELRGWANVAGEMNPVTNAERAGTAAECAALPGIPAWSRVQAVGDMASNMSAVLAPVAMAGPKVSKNVDALVDALMGSDPYRAASDFLADEGRAY